jgi:hypothetical protein
MCTETADDIAKRDHSAAMQSWRNQRPQTKHARITYAQYYANPEETGAEVSAKTPDEMRAAAVELLLLADWYASKPPPLLSC